MRNGQKQAHAGTQQQASQQQHHHHHQRKNQNPMTRVFESNGPDVKIRGTPSHIAEKYVQLARDAQSSGDPVAAENYYQHAEHYFRLIAAAQEQFRQQNPQFNNRPETDSAATCATTPSTTATRTAPATGNQQPMQAGGGEQPYVRHARAAALSAARGAAVPADQQPQQQPQPPAAAAAAGRTRRRRSAAVVHHRRSAAGRGRPAGQAPRTAMTTASRDRFPLHRRRRRHRGPRAGLPAAVSATTPRRRLAIDSCETAGRAGS